MRTTDRPTTRRPVAALAAAAALSWVLVPAAAWATDGPRGGAVCPAIDPTACRPTVGHPDGWFEPHPNQPTHAPVTHARSRLR